MLQSSKKYAMERRGILSQSEIRNIADIINIDYLQTVQNNLSALANITVVLVDSSGEFLSAPTNLCAFCAKIQKITTGEKTCHDLHFQMLEAKQNNLEHSIITCTNSGLKTASVPIFLGPRCLGSWLIGQIRTPNTDINIAKATARKIGFSEKDIENEIDLIPIISEEKLDIIIDFLKNITFAFTEIIESNITLNQKNSELSKLTKKLDSSVQTFKEFIDNTDLGAYLSDFYTGELIMFNSTYSNFLANTTINNCNFKNLEELYPFPSKSKLLNENGTSSVSYEREQYNEILDIWLCLNSHAFYWVDGRLAIMTTFLDITQQKKETERIKHLAYHDHHLGIPNDMKLNLDLEEKMSPDSYIICLNVKGLKEINGVYGREVGDNLLHNIISQIQILLDGKYNIYRIINNDFAILIENSTKEKAMSIATAIYNRFESHWVVDINELSHKLFSSVHIGTFKINDPMQSRSALINAIEKVLLFARRETRPIFFDAAMDEEYMKHTRLVVSLKSCVLNNMEGFSLNYQPVVHSNTGKWADVEALCRWESPELGIVPPDVFIEKAEQIGIIDLIGDWVLEKAISQTKAFGLDKIPDFSLSVNISPLQLSNRRLLPKILELLKKYDYPASKLNLEITESAEVHFDEFTMQILNSIRNAGISLSLDDFGIGYATFSSLKNLPVNVLKIDRSFIKGIENDEYIQRTMQVIVEFAHSVGLTVTVEGVETLEQYEIVNKNGVSLVQGFYFSKPLSVEALVEHIKNFEPDSLL